MIHRATLLLIAFVLAVIACPCSEDSDSSCLGLEYEECYANHNCEAIPYWGESLDICEVDDRGFSDNCPFEGCRSLGSDCPSLEELIEECDEYCSYNSFSIDPNTGCRTCECE